MIEISEFKGKPIFVIRDDNNQKRILFACGIKKAILLLNSIKEIEEFIKNYSEIKNA